MGAYLYILECSDGSLYVGSTRNLENRIQQHDSGRGSVYTRSRRPVRLVYRQEFEHVGEAYDAEVHLHGWSRAKRLALINGQFELLPELARKKWKRDAAPPGE
ncbi:GIY-YIG nuclease family protein [Gordonia sp. GN26]